MTHSADHQEAIAFLGNIQVAEERIECMGINFKKRVGDRRGNAHLETIVFENWRKREPNTLFVVHKEDLLTAALPEHPLLLSAHSPHPRCHRVITSRYAIASFSVL